ncbi:MAG: glycosyltransferase family 39 protein [Deltaproteobacteria bacterium]|nr:glycosyltransferase family 39 protein [Deltaproteobacteria bacterium]
MRLPSVIIGSAVTVIVYLLGKDMFDEKTGFYSALLTNITLIYSIGGILATIDTPFALFWLLASYFGVKAIKTDDGKWWYLKDIALGFGMLSKYIMVLFVPAFLIFLLLSKNHRYWLRRKEPYIGSVIALLIFSPVIIWNAQNDWASFRFQLSHGLQVKSKAGLPSLFEYIGSQAGILSPFLFIACVWGMAKSLIVWIREKDWRYLFLTCTSSFVVLFFGYSSLRAKVEGNWPMSAYFTAIIAIVSLYFKSGYQRKKVFATVVTATAVILTIFVHVQAVSPLITIKKDRTNELHRWKELGLEVGKVLDELRPQKEFDNSKALFIMTTSHQLTAELSFYIPSKPYVYELAGENKFNQYNMWAGPRTGADALLVSTPGREDDAYINSLFDEITEIKRIEPMRNGKVIKTYAVSYCRNFHGFRDKASN